MHQERNTSQILSRDKLAKQQLPEKYWNLNQDLQYCQLIQPSYISTLVSDTMTANLTSDKSDLERLRSMHKSYLVKA
ncbi:hypothetical protein Q3G72_014280 [Acer saccharum]|nr:hypothetical protein Q3G72_014280 [Acer saccharum]